MRLRLLVMVLLALCAWPAASARALEHRRIVGDRGSVGVDQEVEDVLVVDGRLEVAGMVRGHLYALDSDIFVRRTAVVVGSITARGGSFHLEEGAVLPQTIELQKADFYGPKGRSLKPGASLSVAPGSTVVHMRTTSTSTLTEALTRAVLPFDRFRPAEDALVEELAGWAPGLGLEPAAGRKSKDTLLIAGLIRLRLVSDRVRGTWQQGFVGARGRVLVTAMHLDSTASAEELWTQIVSTPVGGATRISIKSSLGDGQHWFLRSRGRYAMLWQRGSWFLAVETQLADDEATITQQQQFNRQVLEALERNLPRKDLVELER